MLNKEQWQTWAVQAQKGDKRAYNMLLREIGHYTQRALSGSLADPDWAEEITQEVLISVHKALPSYSPERPFVPWLSSIIKFRRSDFLRRYYRQKDHKKTPVDDPNFVRSHVTNPVFAGEYKGVEHALGLLPAKQRHVVTMMKVYGHTAKETADKLGMSVSAVKVSVHRTMKKLKGIWE